MDIAGEAMFISVPPLYGLAATGGNGIYPFDLVFLVRVSLEFGKVKLMTPNPHPRTERESRLRRYFAVSNSLQPRQHPGLDRIDPHHGKTPAVEID